MIAHNQNTRQEQVNDHDKRWLIQIIKNKLPTCRIIAFGSRVKGTAKPYSDLDLAIDNSGLPIPSDIFFELQKTFADSEVTYKIDLSDFHEMSDEFKAHISQHMVIWT